MDMKKSKKDYMKNTSISILERMQDRSLFSDADWAVSYYLLKHLDEVSHLTVKELAKKTYSSSGTIIRFSKELGYDGYKSFRVSLIKEMESKKYINQTVDFNMPFDLDSSPQSIINSMSALFKQSIDIAQTSLDAKQLERIADLILKSKRLVLFGIGDSLVTCESFANKLIKIGKLAFPATQNSDAKCVVDIMTKDDVGIFVTYSASSEFLTNYAQTLKKNHVPIITLSGNHDSILAEISDETVLFKDMEGSTDEKIATFYSQNVFSYILNCIYSLLYSKIN